MHTDFLIVGAGIIGVNIALEVKKRYPDQRVVVIEKEAELGRHASGRNSGVIHAGFYYTADSLKARFTRDGNHELKQYCLARNIKINPCGKLVIATNETELTGLETLFQRGLKNNVELLKIDEKTALEIEPRVKVFGNQALFSPTTASANPVEVLLAVRNEAEDLGVKFLFRTEFLHQSNSATHTIVHTNREKLVCQFLINAAGLYADKVAHSFGVGKKYRILPFKGLYLYSNETPGQLRTNIYPVPNLANPFLGVHFTITVDGHIKIGPTAIPAFWREQYKGLQGFRLSEFCEISSLGLGLLSSNPNNLRHVAIDEMKSLFKSRIVKKASRLAKGVSRKQFIDWAPTGIRAQLFDLEKNALEMDFVIEDGPRSIHVLNAVSPGWTCAIPFSRHVVDRMARGVTHT